MSEIGGLIDRKISVYCVIHKMSQDSFAKLMGISTNTLHSKRSGYTDWKWSEILQLSEILGESPNELAGIA